MNNFRTYLFIIKFSLAAFLFSQCVQSISIYSQNLIYQETFYGGVTGAGFSTGLGTGSGSTVIHIEPGSTIKKVFMIHNRQGYAANTFFEINGTAINTDTLEYNNKFLYTADWCNPFFVYFRDITNIISITSDTISVLIPSQQNQICWTYNALYFVVLYENSIMPLVNISLILNSQELVGNENYLINNLNPFNSNQPIGFAIFSDRSEEGLPISPKKEVYFNSNFLGAVGGIDAVNSQFLAAGVKGHFYYQNNQLYGLDDDVPNATMDSTDGLADVSSYITNNATSCNFQLKHVNYPIQPENRTHVNLAYFLTYTTPCDTFSTTLTDNINVCKGAQAQLNATGGIAYEWLPQVGLSCYNCPNPIVTADTINYYTCRIWNTDSCSKVLPIKINILPLPIMPTIAVNPTLCSGNTGHIHITNQSAAYTYTLDGGTPQTTLHFTNLSAGNHLLTIQTANGCSIDTLLTVAEVNNVVAQFTASPTIGDVPLTVNFTNQSTNATNYIWYIENDTLNTTQANHTFDTSGIFTVTLVAYNTFPQCSDTATITIVAEYPFTIIAPSLYIGDENYTPYQIYTSGVTELHYELFTDQGKLVYNKVLLPTAGTVSLWDSTQLAKGIYLYRIWAVDEDGVDKVITGKVVVI